MSTALWLFVMNLGTVFGAGVYEARISVSRWLDDSGWHAAAARHDDVGRRFWGMAATVPLTLLVLVNGWLAWRARSVSLTIAVGAALVDRALTFGYFIPTMARLLDAADAPNTRRCARRWARLNYLRLVCVLVAWIAALATLQAT